MPFVLSIEIPTEKEGGELWTASILQMLDAQGLNPSEGRVPLLGDIEKHSRPEQPRRPLRMLSAQSSSTTEKYNKVDIPTSGLKSPSSHKVSHSTSNMSSTKCKTLSRMPKKIRDPKDYVSSVDIYDIDLDYDNLVVLDHDSNDSGAVMPNCTDHDSRESSEFDLDYFDTLIDDSDGVDKFIDECAWKSPVLETEKDKTKDAETQTVDNTAIVLNGDTTIAGLVPPETAEVPTSSSSTKEVSSEVFDKIDWDAFLADETDWTPINGQRHPEEQQPEINSATTGSHSTSEAEGSICTLGTGEAYSRNQP
jgi:hypothetical protein